MHGIMQYVSFRAELFSTEHNPRHSFFLLNGAPTHDSATVCLALGSTSKLFGALRNKSTGNICAEGFAWTYFFISLRQMPKTEIAGLYDKCMFT